MPRGRGGRRRGKAGKPYANRSDLRAQPISVPTGGEYGSRKASEDAQRAIPLSRPAEPAVAPEVGAAPTAMPGQIPFSSDSAFPNEPVTAGAPMGMGPGPEALVTRPPPPTLIDTLASLPNASPELRALAEEMALAATPDDVLLDYS